MAQISPPLTTPIAVVDAALSASPDAHTRRTVLLVDGTANEVVEAWSWGYQRALPRAGFAVCTVELPGNALVGMFRSVQYVVCAIRFASRIAGQDVAVVGHSQGGTLLLWALAFWPDIRETVDEFVGLAPVVSGSLDANLGCATGSCAPLGWQLRRGSAFFAALGARVSPRLDYTVVYTQFDGDRASTAGRQSHPRGQQHRGAIDLPAAAGRTHAHAG